jgi:malate permease and related proteins
VTLNPITAQVLTSVAKTFALMGVGIAFQRFWKRDISVVTDLAMTLFVPCLAFSVIVGQELEAVALATVAGAAVFVIFGTLALSWVCFKLFRIRERGLYLPVVFMNAANLPFPIIEANYGRTGLGYAVLYYVAVLALLYTLGVAIVARAPNPRILLRTPSTIAALAALLVQALRLPVPGLLLETTDLIGRAAIPIVLFIFGYSLGTLKVEHFGIGAFGSVLRLGLGLGLGWLAAYGLRLTGTMRDVVIVMSAMPSAVVNVVIARQYAADPEIVASVVFLTSVAAIGLLPLLLVLLRT